MRERKQIYLDGAANAPLGKEAAKAMEPYLKPGFCGNANSAHYFGSVADAALHDARTTIARCLEVPQKNVLFTSGATESNNWVIKSLAMAELAKPEDQRRTRIVVSATEHASVLSACDSLKPLGFTVVHVAPTYDGSVLVSSMRKAMRKGKTLLVCCMAVNNETGAVNPADEVAVAAHEAGAYMLCDITQALSLGGEALKVRKRYPHADFLSFSAHKLYGPTGVGCLIKFGEPLPSLMSGGSQEFGLRSGTSNVAGAVGMAAAIDSLAKCDETKHYTDLMDLLTYELGAILYDCCGDIGPRKINTVRCNCRKEKGSPYIISLDFSEVIDYPGVLANAFSSYGIAVSAGSACSVDGDDQKPSHVLLAMGRSEHRISHTVRVSFTKFTKPSDIKAFVAAAKKLAGQFPLQERKNENE